MRPDSLLVAVLALAGSGGLGRHDRLGAVGDPGNACDRHAGKGCFGAVGYAYRIGTYEVTNAQYAEFLNAKAAADPLGLYNTNMGIVGFRRHHAQRRARGATPTARSPAARDMPVNFVSFYDALRFANWLHNGAGRTATRRRAPTRCSAARRRRATPTVHAQRRGARSSCRARTSGTRRPTTTRVGQLLRLPGGLEHADDAARRRPRRPTRRTAVTSSAT